MKNQTPFWRRWRVNNLETFFRSTSCPFGFHIKNVLVGCESVIVHWMLTQFWFSVSLFVFAEAIAEFTGTFQFHSAAFSPNTVKPSWFNQRTAEPSVWSLYIVRSTMWHLHAFSPLEISQFTFILSYDRRGEQDAQILHWSCTWSSGTKICVDNTPSAIDRQLYKNPYRRLQKVPSEKTLTTDDRYEVRLTNSFVPDSNFQTSCGTPFTIIKSFECSY